MAIKDFDITKEILHQYFEYKDGVLYWKLSVSNNVKASYKAGCTNNNGYTIIKLFKKYIYAHRAIFMMFNDYVPNIVDHIDGNARNNRIENLRDTSKAQNAWNSKLHKNNSSGIRGVSWNKQTGKWKAEIRANGQCYFLGRFSTLESAKKAIDLARNKYHGKYARIN